mmetsp:Transcript_38598/g.82046  ORF Transcript_38598/g.82046 Transcript_38598/m.82046 type:complete len:297 (+) Transcript_38598:396-1286(+)
MATTVSMLTTPLSLALRPKLLPVLVARLTIWHLADGTWTSGTALAKPFADLVSGGAHPAMRAIAPRAAICNPAADGPDARALLWWALRAGATRSALRFTTADVTSRRALTAVGRAVAPRATGGLALADLRLQRALHGRLVALRAWTPWKAACEALANFVGVWALSPSARWARTAWKTLRHATAYHPVLDPGQLVGCALRARASRPALLLPVTDLRHRRATRGAHGAGATRAAVRLAAADHLPLGALVGHAHGARARLGALGPAAADVSSRGATYHVAVRTRATCRTRPLARADISA